jgi:hypothetical protein
MLLEALPVDRLPSCGQLDLTNDQGAAFVALDDEPPDDEDEEDDEDDVEDDDVDEEDDELPLDESEDLEPEEDESELVELAAAFLFLSADSERLSVR